MFRFTEKGSFVSHRRGCCVSQVESVVSHRGGCCVSQGRVLCLTGGVLCLTGRIVVSDGEAGVMFTRGEGGVCVCQCSVSHHCVLPSENLRGLPPEKDFLSYKPRD